MKYTICPLCGRDVFSGSHWDCVFAILESWSKRFDKELPQQSDGLRKSLADLTERLERLESLQPQGVVVKEGDERNG